MLTSGLPDAVFAHTFLLLSWNLICRAGNTASICLAHMEFGDDCLKIYFAQMKNDQAAERPKDPRHVFANPLKPAICPLLSLGIYFLLEGFEAQGNRLFHGGVSPYERYNFALIVGTNHALMDDRFSCLT